MGINLNERFEVGAPLDGVWRFLIDPTRVVACVPGAGLEDVVDDRTFVGTIRVKVGPIVTSYRGQVRFVELDAAGRVIRIEAEGVESSGGTAKATMLSRLEELPGGGTGVVAEATAEVTGRIMQFGQGMIEGVSHRLFQQFVASLTERLALEESGAVGAIAGGDGPAPPVENQPLPLLPLLARSLWDVIARFFRRLFRRQAA